MIPAVHSGSNLSCHMHLISDRFALQKCFDFPIGGLVAFVDSLGSLSHDLHHLTRRLSKLRRALRH
jgi:hypothetical protein